MCTPLLSVRVTFFVSMPAFHSKSCTVRWRPDFRSGLSFATSRITGTSLPTERHANILLSELPRRKFA